MSDYRQLLLATWVACSAFGCEEDLQVAPPPPPAKETAAVVEAATPAITENEEEYVRPEYPNSSRRNPFQPDPEVISPQARATEGEVRDLEPLEQYGLGQLTLVAVISEVAVPIAMFIDPTGFGHFVKEGDRVGRNSGVISDIRDNEVEVLEGGDDEDSQTLQRIVRLRDGELSSGEEGGLSDEEKAALERLLETEEGRKALQRTFQDNAAGANAVEQQETTNGNVDPRFRGFAPPADN